MGQGLHTKVAQIAASAFNIPLSSVFISDTSTDKVLSYCFERYHEFVTLKLCTYESHVLMLAAN